MGENLDHAMQDALVPVVLALSVFLVISIGCFLAYWAISKQMDSLEHSVNESLKSYADRLKAVEHSVHDLQKDAGERLPDSMQGVVAGVHQSLEADSTPRHPRLSAYTPGHAADRPQHNWHENRGLEAREATNVPADPRAEFERQAQEALASVTKFNNFVAKYSAGSGYVLDPAGISSLPTPLQGPADKADLWAFVFQDHREIYAGFNLRRNIALYAGDAGRPAEARLGWLFDIIQGEDVRVHEPAFVASDDWSVLRKGRLAMPL
jgi:hypothetical protein